MFPSEICIETVDENELFNPQRVSVNCTSVVQFKYNLDCMLICGLICICNNSLQSVEAAVMWRPSQAFLGCSLTGRICTVAIVVKVCACGRVDGVQPLGNQGHACQATGSPDAVLWVG